MSMWKRHSLPAGTTFSGEIVEGEGLSGLIKDSPLSTHFSPNCGDSPTNLKNFMRALQVRQYGCSIELSDRVLIRNIKLLLEEYSPMMVKRGIKFASKVSDYPFSTKFVKEMIEQIKDQI